MLSWLRSSSMRGRLGIWVAVAIAMVCIPSLVGDSNADPISNENYSDRWGTCSHNEPSCLRGGLSEPGTKKEVLGFTTGILSPDSFRVVQLNLCNSGYARCYRDGKSPEEARSLLESKAIGADFVTLNEICEDDVQYLFNYLRVAWPEDYTYWVFKPARRADNGAAYPCKDGGKFGIGIVGRLPASDWAGLTPFAGIYPAQDRSSNEERAWLCVAATGNYLGCATHLESSSGSLAMRQCKYLMSAIASIKRSSSQIIPTVIAGDLNLTHGGSSRPDVQGCVPNDYFRKGDGDRQHILVSKGFSHEFHQKIKMKYTDHPALLMSLGTS